MVVGKICDIPMTKWSSVKFVGNISFSCSVIVEDEEVNSRILEESLVTSSRISFD